MMRFEYLRPITIEEAISLLCKYDGKAKVIAGGTDLVVQLRTGAGREEQLVRPQYLIDI